ncbi:hypothetical protein ACH5RR_005483 [Cinchona calisaya]|uniref:Uncharacterized protein n=1 Tax=Cinchona calisaya TaxID=153742 RepID=A0ABD3AL88_9GENT
METATEHEEKNKYFGPYFQIYWTKQARACRRKTPLFIRPARSAPGEIQDIIPPEQQRLIFAGKQSEDAVNRLFNMFSVSDAVLSQDACSLVENNVKAKIHDKEGIPPDRWENPGLADYNIQNESTLRLQFNV